MRRIFGGAERGRFVCGETLAGGRGPRSCPGTCRGLPGLLCARRGAMGAWAPLCLLSAALAAAASGESRPGSCPEGGRRRRVGALRRSPPPGCPCRFWGASSPSLPGRGSVWRPPPFWLPPGSGRLCPLPKWARGGPRAAEVRGVPGWGWAGGFTSGTAPGAREGEQGAWDS